MTRSLSDTIARLREADAEIRDVSKTYDGEAIFVINALVERLRIADEALKLIMKNSTNFRLKGPDYLIDKCEAALDVTDLTKGEL